MSYADPADTTEPPPERKAAARAIWEGTPADADAVAAEVGVPPFWVRRWKREGKWKKAAGNAAISERAARLANAYATAAADKTAPISSQPAMTPEDARAAAQQIAQEIATDFAVDVRAQVIDRHRKEWNAPRTIAYEAIAKARRGDTIGAFEHAKLAKILSETFTLVQAGECKAYGIEQDDKGKDGSTIVVIERATQAAEDSAARTKTPLPAAPANPDEDTF